MVECKSAALMLTSCWSGCTVF